MELSIALERARGAAAVTDPKDAEQVREVGLYCGELLFTVIQADPKSVTYDAGRDLLWTACVEVWNA